MDNQTVMAIVIVVAVVVVLGAVWYVMRRQRTMRLRDKFGPEYERALRSSPSPAVAERELEERQRRVEKFALRPLSREAAEDFTAEWRRVQARFVDDPRTAVVDADRLITDVMRGRGYPVEDRRRRLDDLSVEHARVVNHYRAATEIVDQHAAGTASTEDLRQAMVHFRALFDELVAGQPHDVRRAS